MPAPPNARHRLGFDAIELHAAHCHLLHEFLSPLANRREDDHGGSLGNRLRFPLEVFDVARAAFPGNKPIGVRLSATDRVTGGWDIEQSIALCKALHNDPRWPWHTAVRLGAQVKAPRQYWRCQPADSKELFGPTRIGGRGSATFLL